MFILGIDPGANGGATLLSDSGMIIDVIDFAKNTLVDIADAFAEYQIDEDTKPFAFIEKVHSMPKQGVSSTFKFGYGYGFLVGVLTALKIPYEMVTPQTWQKALSCRSKGNKNITKAKAQQLFPDHKWTHHTADSVLIAEFGRRIKK